VLHVILSDRAIRGGFLLQPLVFRDARADRLRDAGDEGGLDGSALAAITHSTLASPFGGPYQVR